MASPPPTALKDRFSSLDTLAVVREVRLLERARVDKAFDRPGGGVVLVLRVPAMGRRDLVLVTGRYAAVLGPDSPRDEDLGPMARELRRLLTGAVLVGAREPNGERVLDLEFRRGDVEEPLRLIAELFGTGNLLVVRGPKLVAVQHPRVWAHRSVKIGAVYVPPPARGDPWAFRSAEFETALLASRTDRVSTLAARLGFGGPVAEELLTRADLVPTAPATERAGEAAVRVHRAVEELLQELGDRPRGFLYSRDGVAIDVEPFASRRLANAETTVTEFDRFSDAASRYFADLPSVAPKLAGAGKEVAELRRLIERQTAAISDLAAEVVHLKAQAEAIYAHYPEAEAALAEAEPKEKETALIVRLGDVDVALRRGRAPRESAQGLFDEGKRVQSKLQGARSALAETQSRLERSVAPSPTGGTPSADARSAPRKPHWFERYRWFVSSEGAVVIGGRDASSNDLLVRRYLNPMDIYVHADIHGAPSVIVKHPAPGEPAMTDATFVEAGQWGVAFSKAWRAGLASASAFWVTADQVSKSGATGEFVPRGAWVIHGTKHVLKDLPTELAIGPVTVQGEELLSVAPPSAVRARGEIRFLITPGEERDRPAREVELSEALGVSRSRIQGMLPAGGLALRRA